MEEDARQETCVQKISARYKEKLKALKTKHEEQSTYLKELERFLTKILKAESDFLTHLHHLLPTDFTRDDPGLRILANSFMKVLKELHVQQAHLCKVATGSTSPLPPPRP